MTIRMNADSKKTIAGYAKAWKSSGWTESDVVDYLILTAKGRLGALERDRAKAKNKGRPAVKKPKVTRKPAVKKPRTKKRALTGLAKTRADGDSLRARNGQPKRARKAKPRPDGDSIRNGLVDSVLGTAAE